MEILPKVTTVRHKVGECPACRSFLWAEVDLQVRIGEPMLTQDSRPHVFAAADVIAMRVNHEYIKVDDEVMGEA
jgi:hypothetical protein